MERESLNLRHYADCKKKAFNEINDDWNAYIEQVEQYFIANEIKEEKSVSDAKPNGKQNIRASTKSDCSSKAVRSVF